MFAAALLLSCLAAPPGAPPRPAADGVWLDGLPELLAVGATFQLEEDGDAFAVSVFSAAEARTLRDGAAAARERWETGPPEPLPPPDLQTVIACGNGRLSFFGPRGFLRGRPPQPVVAHVSLARVTAVKETAARFAERTGTPVPGVDSPAPEPSPAGGDGAGE